MLANSQRIETASQQPQSPFLFSPASADDERKVALPLPAQSSLEFLSEDEFKTAQPKMYDFWLANTGGVNSTAKRALPQALDWTPYLKMALSDADQRDDSTATTQVSPHATVYPTAATQPSTSTSRPEQAKLTPSSAHAAPSIPSSFGASAADESGRSTIATVAPTPLLTPNPQQPSRGEEQRVEAPITDSNAAVTPQEDTVDPSDVVLSRATTPEQSPNLVPSSQLSHMMQPVDDVPMPDSTQGEPSEDEGQPRPPKRQAGRTRNNTTGSSSSQDSSLPAAKRVRQARRAKESDSDDEAIKPAKPHKRTANKAAKQRGKVV